MSENVVDKCGISSWSSADTDTNLPSDQGETDTECAIVTCQSQCQTGDLPS